MIPPITPMPSAGAQFLTSLDVRDIEDRNWILLAPFLVYVLGRIIRIEAGFITDFASVPRIPLAFWLFGNLGHRAALVHDWLYSSGECTREEADKILLELLILSTRAPARDDPPTGWRRVVQVYGDWLSEAAGTARAYAMWAGVRVGGAPHYNQGDGKVEPK